MKTRLACVPSFLSIALHLFKCLQGREEQVRERESWRGPVNSRWRGLLFWVNQSLLCVFCTAPSSVIFSVFASFFLLLLTLCWQEMCLALVGCFLPVPSPPGAPVDPEPPFCGSFVCTIHLGDPVGCNGCKRGLGFCPRGLWGAGTSCYVHEEIWVCQRHMCMCIVLLPLECMHTILRHYVTWDTLQRA